MEVEEEPEKASLEEAPARPRLSSAASASQKSDRPLSAMLSVSSSLPGSEKDFDAWALKYWTRLDRDRSGKITRKELECDDFYDIFKSVFPAAKGQGSSSGHAAINLQQTVQFCLQKADANFDGTLTFEEFKSLVSMLLNPEANFAYQMVYALFDVDGSKSLDKAEFREMYRFLLGKDPSSAEQKEEWDRFVRLCDITGDDYKVTLEKFMLWLQTSGNPSFRSLAPPLGSGGGKKGKARRKLDPVHLGPRWKKIFVSGVYPGHINDYRPQGTREYFMRSHSEVELTSFYKTHAGFDAHLKAVDGPIFAPRSNALDAPTMPTRNAGLSKDSRHSMGGSMRDHRTKEITLWEDNWTTPLRLRSNGPPSYRPLASRSTFSDPEFQPGPPKYRLGPMALRKQRKGEGGPLNQIKPSRPTALEAEPW
jgi:Ca2+-binding EF-hand superfamily protein